MTFLYTFFGVPLGYIMWVCYLLTRSIGLSIIVFSIIIKIASFPLTLKQQRNTAMSQLFMPRLKEIQTKYRNNSQKMQEETAKLQKEGYNPAGGCLPMILMFVILFGVIDVVYKPMTHFERFDGVEKGSIAIVKEIAIQIEQKEYLEAAKGRAETDKGYTYIENKYKYLQSENYAIHVYKTHREEFDRLGREKGLNPEIIKKLETLSDRIVFLGIDFSEMPTVAFTPMILIPILSFVFSVAQTLLTQYIQNKTMPGMNEQMGAMKYMMYIMPLFSLFIVFQFPAGAGFYWTVQAILGIAQSLIIYKFWPPEKLKDEAIAELEKRNSGFKADRVVVVEPAGTGEADGGDKPKTKLLSEMSNAERKEYNRKKLEKARQEDLEKYGELPDSDPESNETE